MKIALNVGHSARDGGCVNSSFGMSEHIYNYYLVRDVADALKSLGHVSKVVIQADDVDFADLPPIINSTKSDLCVSFHCNAFNGIASGTECLHWHSSSRGLSVATTLSAAVAKALGLPDRGAKPIRSGERGAAILRRTTMPCVLLESFFLDNDSDYKAAIKSRKKLLSAIVKTIGGFQP